MAAVKLYDLARMTTATVGTGTITLGVAVSPYISFAQAGVQNGDTVRYAIYDPTVGGSEIGTGVYTTSGTTLTRNPTTSTAVGNLAIGLSGQAQVFITASALDILGPIVTPEMFGGGTSMSAAVNQSAFAAMAAYVNASAPNANIQFAPGANYAVWATDPGNVVLMAFNATNGLSINFNGAKITSAMVADAESQTVMAFFGPTVNLTVRDAHYEQTAFGNTTPTASAGANLITIEDNATNVLITDTYMVGGVQGIAVTRTSSANRATGITILGGYFSSVFYPLSFQKNGDGVTARDIYCTNVGRTYFPYNVKNHSISFVENYVANVSPTVLLKCYALATESLDLNTLSDIEVDATFTSSAPLTSGLAYVTFQYQQQTSTNSRGVMKNIRLRLNADALGVGASSNAITVQKVDSSGNPDTATRGYVFDNIMIGGKVSCGFGPVQVFNGFNGSGEVWSASGTTSSIAAGTNSFTGAIAGNVLTASSVTGTLYVGTTIATGAAAGTQIIAQLTGTPGGAGTYIVSIGQTVSSTAMTGTYGLLTVGGSVTGIFAVGDILAGTGIVANSFITELGSGTGGAGTYAVNNNTVVSSTLITAADVVRNVIFRDFIAIDSTATNSIVFTATGLTGPFVFENLYVDQPVSITGGGSNVQVLNATAPSGLVNQIGVQPIAVVSNKFLTSISANGLPALAQPSVSNLSGLPVTGAQGGTGVNNSTQTITVASNFVTTGGALTFGAPGGGGTFTLPATDTLVGRASTDILTNKTLTSSTDVLGGVTMMLGSDATGDIYYRSGGVLTRLGIGSTGDFLTISGGVPAWSAGVGISSVSNSDGTLTISPTTGAVVASIALGHANTWSGAQTFVAPILGAATATSVTFNPTTNGIVGTTTNDSAASGVVGQVISSNLASGSAIGLSNSTATDITTISLTAGDWDVSGTIGLLQNVATLTTQFIGWISTTSATLPAGYPTPNNGAIFIINAPFAAGVNLLFPTGTMRLSLSAPATIYLSTFATFTVNTNAGYGFIRARRVR